MVVFLNWLRDWWRGGLENLLWRGRVVRLPADDLTTETAIVVVGRLKMLARENSRPVLLWCDGLGGSVVLMLSLMACIKGLRCPVVTAVQRRASSAHAEVFMAGHWRYMHRWAVLKTHAPRFYKDVPKHEDVYQALRQLQKEGRRLREKSLRRRLPDAFYGRYFMDHEVGQAMDWQMAQGSFRHTLGLWLQVQRRWREAHKKNRG